MSEGFPKEIESLGLSIAELSEIHRLERTVSTNEDAAEGARRGAPHGSLWVAESQSAGKGRLGRSWESKPGLGLYFSLLLRPAMKAATAPLASLAVGLALGEALRAQGVQSLIVKWPNDLLIDGRKLGGILTEMVNRGAEVDFLIIGVGLNIAQKKSDFSAELQDKALSLAQATGREWNPVQILAEVLPRIFTTIEALARGGEADLLRDWEKKSGMVGKALSYVTDGGAPREGRVLGLDELGRLRVEHRDGGVAELIAEDTTLL